ncbi:hypothetical protein BCR44DRAFT_118477 [Catenaria anguillulae PL171]|uniref:Pre-mRNA-splicing factor CWC2 n=1 Tax=Catenaria anguillulae PL171 TaxID=765915 RepID=A0A1Y2H1A7_9FUNG|nr:hypothetical protein BCR44DRAFT_118477 [Catenaria anguillulae PL171]
MSSKQSNTTTTTAVARAGRPPPRSPASGTSINTAPASNDGSGCDPVLRSKIIKQVNEWLKRPARRQADPDAAEQTQKVYEGSYNIWYNKWTGQKHKGRFEFGERAASRVNISRDTGFTLADKRRAQNPNHRTYICLQFARGMCHKGHKCEYLHRIPLPDDLEETMKDCFGRERHRDEREDMNGVGCFNRENRTVYIGGMHPYEKGDAEKVIRKHFIAFGPIDRLNVIYDKTIAFVRYEKRANAEFAKEAMEHQALDAGEVIRLRWANDDPNPREIEANKKRREHEFVDAYVAKKARTGEVTYLDEEAKKLIESNPIYQQYYASYSADADTNAGTLTDQQDQEYHADQSRAIQGAPSSSSSAANQGATQGEGHEQEQAVDEATMQAYYAQYYAQYYGQYGLDSNEEGRRVQQQGEANASTSPPVNKAAPALVAYASDEEDE